MMSTSPYWAIFGLTTVILFLKMFAVAGVQGYHRLKYRVFVNPEDAAFFGKTAPAVQELPIVQLASKTLHNDLENIPLFLFLVVAYIQLQGWLTGLMIYCGLFVLARIGHTLCYLKPRQPLRNRMYLLGQLANFCLCGHILYQIFQPR